MSPIIAIRKCIQPDNRQYRDVQPRLEPEAQLVAQKERALQRCNHRQYTSLVSRHHYQYRNFHYLTIFIVTITSTNITIQQYYHKIRNNKSYRKSGHSKNVIIASLLYRDYDTSLLSPSGDLGIGLV